MPAPEINSLGIELSPEVSRLVACAVNAFQQEFGKNWVIQPVDGKEKGIIVSNNKIPYKFGIELKNGYIIPWHGSLCGRKKTKVLHEFKNRTVELYERT